MNHAYHAYNDALQLATLALYAEGYRPGKQRSHERAINSLEYTVGAKKQIVDVLDVARRKRNTASYDRAGEPSDKQAREMISLATELRASVVVWLRKKHPDLIG
jgi:hypothetical protein